MTARAKRLTASILIDFSKYSLVCKAHGCVCVKDSLLESRLQSGDRAVRDRATELLVAEKCTPPSQVGVPAHDYVELELVDQSLERTGISSSGRGYKKLRMVTARLQPLHLVSTKFVRQELATPRMSVVASVNLGVSLEANWNCVLNVIRAAIRSGNDIIDLDLHAAEPMADGAPPMGIDEQLRDLIAIEWQP